LKKPSLRLAVEINKGVLPTDDLVVADLVIQAASGADVETDIIARLQERI
jgi:hypothetical protein